MLRFNNSGTPILSAGIYILAHVFLNASLPWKGSGKEPPSEVLWAKDKEELQNM